LPSWRLWKKQVLLERLFVGNKRRLEQQEKLQIQEEADKQLEAERVAWEDSEEERSQIDEEIKQRSEAERVELETAARAAQEAWMKKEHERTLGLGSCCEDVNALLCIEQKHPPSFDNVYVPSDSGGDDAMLPSFEQRLVWSNPYEYNSFGNQCNKMGARHAPDSPAAGTIKGTGKEERRHLRIAGMRRTWKSKRETCLRFLPPFNFIQKLLPEKPQVDMRNADQFWKDMAEQRERERLESIPKTIERSRMFLRRRRRRKMTGRLLKNAFINLLFGGLQCTSKVVSQFRVICISCLFLEMYSTMYSCRFMMGSTEHRRVLS
jgi:hypothetical protein